MPSQEVLDKYENARLSLENAIKASDDIELRGEEENAELNYVRETLSQLNNDFKNEITRLENSSEWDKFCIAFFGETNAGKSTIIEALRIVFDEESRREEIKEQEKTLQKEVTLEKENYSKLISSIKQFNDSLANNAAIEKKNHLLFLFLFALGIIIGFLVCFLVFSLRSLPYLIPCLVLILFPQRVNLTDAYLGLPSFISFSFYPRNFLL